MKNPHFRVIDTLLHSLDRRRVIYFVSPRQVVKATRQRKYVRRDLSETILLTFGKPNYAERRHIKLLKHTREPFPVKKMRVEPWPKKRQNVGKKQ